mgnify:CR=1 FL=1|jgi:hypothetical protein
MKCEFCDTPVKLHTGLCSGCWKFGRTITEYIRYHELDIPEWRIHDVQWLRRNAGIRNSDHPAFPRLMEMLKQC